MTVDSFGRNLHYLRISLTDKCNLRCVYCMDERTAFRPNAELMQDEELITLVRAFADLGFDKFRLTGGEPTLHPNIVELVRRMTEIPGVRSLSMTTNGMLLHKLAQPLAGAGLERVNISVDTLNPQRFHQITRRGNVHVVLAGILAAEAAGLTPIKLNTVVMRGFNEADAAALARLTLDHPWQVRFIEMMPFGVMADFARQQIFAERDIQARIEAVFGPLTELGNGELDGEARLYRIPGAAGTIGLISSISRPFCGTCSRVRLTADGALRLCLLRDDEVNLLSPLRQGASFEEIKAIIAESLWRKPWGHLLSEDGVPQTRLMSQIGG